MTHINTNGRVTVTSEVRGADELTTTIDNATQYVLNISVLEQLSTDPKTKKTNQVVGWLKTDTDFDELGIDEIKMLRKFIVVAGKNHYDAFTIAEYAYMYTSILDRINAVNRIASN